MARRCVRLVCTSAAIGFITIPASAAEIRRVTPPPDKYGITDQERAACTADAIEYCSDTFPDEDKLLTCMKLNHANLSSGCRLVFDQGVHRRRL